MRQRVPSTSRRLRAAVLCGFVAGLTTALSGCGGGSSPGQSAQPAAVNSAATKPGGSGLLNGNAFIVQSSQAGKAVEWRLTDMAWGRLVDVYDTVPTSPDYASNPLDPANYDSRLVYPDFVIGQSIDTAFDGGELRWELGTSPVNGRQSLRISSNAETEKALFGQRVIQAASALEPVDPKSLMPSELPPFPVIARNATLVLSFDDLIDETTLGLHTTLKVLAGDPAIVPYDARVLPDPNFGAIDSSGKFRSSRILVDFTITADELDDISQVVQVNGIGLPPSDGNNKPNLAIKIPTRVEPGFGQFSILTNPAGTPLDTGESGPVDFVSPSIDIAWALRAGNAEDENNGFLVDGDAPRIVGIQPGMIVAALDDPDGAAGIDLLLSLKFDIEDCAVNPQPGDLIQISPILSYAVTESGTVVGTNVTNLAVSILPGDTGVDAAALAGTGIQYLTPWRQSLGAAKAPCFVRFSPSAGAPPAVEVSPEADVLVRFSEPLSPQSLAAFDTIYIARAANIDASLTEAEGGLVPPKPTDLVLGTLLSSADGLEVRFKPSVPFDHTEGSEESYYFNLLSNAFDGGVTDLAGNVLDEPFERVAFRIASGADTVATGGWVMRFNTLDEDQEPDGGLDIRGQILFDESDGAIRPRPVQRFAAVVDRNVEPMISVMTPITIALETPLSAQGSKAHALWRYMDVSFDITQQDDIFFNLDIEGISLSPFGGNVVSTTFDEFEMRMGHARSVPDELYIPPPVNAMAWPNSGFGPTSSFSENYLQGDGVAPVVVHPRELGYAVSQSKVFTGPTGLQMLQMPWNEGLSEQDKKFFTWRDNSIQAYGHQPDEAGFLLSIGVPTDQEVAVVMPVDEDGLAIPTGDVYGFGANPPGSQPWSLPVPPGVPTTGLPLLMEFRCFPTEDIAFNGFDMSFAAPAGFIVPHFRAHSTGGTDTIGSVVIKDPDLQNDPTGGFNIDPTVGAIGAATVPRDDTVYQGQMDIVIRTSRAHTILMDAVGDATSLANPADYDYVAVVTEPTANKQPVGTSVTFAWRGIQLPSLTGREVMLRAEDFDTYGEPAFGPIAPVLDMNGMLQPATAQNGVFPWPNPAWSNSLSAIDGLRFVQTRITFIGNTESEVTPRLDSYGLAFFR